MAARKHCTCRRFRLRARSPPLGRPTFALEPARACSGATESSKSIAQSPTKSRSAARASPRTAECSKSAARACSGATESSKSVARVYPRAAVGSKSAALAHSCEVRSFLALENCWLLFVCYRHQLLLGSTLLRRPRLELAARARSASLGRSTGQSRTKTNRTRQVELTRRRLAGQDHGCLLHSTQRRTFSVHGMHGYALVYIYIYIFFLKKQ